MIRAAAEPLPPADAPDFGQAFDRYADRRVVLLGEASHGTAEFYLARAAITRRLVQTHGFRFVAVEADWPDAATIDRHVRLQPSTGGLAPFARFPTWMWRNREFADFVAWLRAHNAPLDAAQRVAFHGLDLYSLSASIAAVLDYLDREDPAAARVARERYGCLSPWRQDPAVYGRLAHSPGFAGCEDAVIAQLRDLLRRRLDDGAAHTDGLFDATQNARLVASAERYYRSLYRGAAQSWNLRDTHMFETLWHLLDSHGPEARAVVWAHNSHIGNAAATDMGKVRGELNLGQLCRERFGEAAALIGFGTHTGTVAAASDWDGPMHVKAVRPSREDSYEYQFHQAGASPFLLDLGERADRRLLAALREPRLERYIGVIYRPETELYSHYAEAALSEQFDAFVWFDETRALTPLDTAAGSQEAAQTWPFGL
ncbi:hypothetical protein GCM10025795_34640 [Verticiella sediminum]